MIKFEHQEYLWLLASIIPLLLFFALYMWWRARAAKSLGDQNLVAELMPLRSTAKHYIKLMMSLIAITFLAIGLANPQIGTKYEKVERKGVDLIVALDVSKSMLAEDIKPNRIQRAKQYISRFVQQLKSDRVGLVIFAGNAYLQLPLTSDYAATRMFLNTVSTDLVPTQGTAIGEAVRLAISSFEAGEKKHKALLIITDGENHEGEALEAVEEAVKEGIIVHAIGVGTAKGAPIPIYNGSRQVDYKRDKQNSIVLSKLNETMLQQLAVVGNGQYYRMSSRSDQMKDLLNQIASMETKQFDEKVFTDYEDQFQYFLAVALVFLLLEFFVSERKFNWFYPIRRSA